MPLERLDGTRIRTNIRRDDGEEEFRAFGLIDGAAVARKFGTDGRMLWAEITLSDWVFDAIRERQVLTLHPRYFRLRKPLERRIYELARKHCGQDPYKKLNVPTLHRKSGSKSPLKHFRYLLKETAEKDHLPDYAIEFDAEADQVMFINRNTMPRERENPDEDAAEILLRLSADVGEKAREIAVGWDVHALKNSFASWWAKIGKPTTRDADALFLKFCRTWQEKHGKP